LQNLAAGIHPIKALVLTGYFARDGGMGIAFTANCNKKSDKKSKMRFSKTTCYFLPADPVYPAVENVLQRFQIF
jgi:hypothetical protein